MNSPYDQIPGMQMESGSGKSALKVIVGLVLCLIIGFALGNLYYFNIDSGLFTSVNREAELQVKESLEQNAVQKESLEKLKEEKKALQTKFDNLEKLYAQALMSQAGADFQLVISEPQKGAEIDADVVTFKGKVSDAGVKLVVDSAQEIPVKEDGSFEFQYPLGTGENNVGVTASLKKDGASKYKSLTWTVNKKGNWKEIARFVGGNGTKNTNKFTIKGKEARITVKPTKIGNYMSATLYQTPKKYEKLLYNKAGEDLKEPGTIKYYKPGEYYIEVFSTKTDWEIVVESLE